jgi:hypothetical protein
MEQSNHQLNSVETTEAYLTANGIPFKVSHTLRKITLNIFSRLSDMM